MSVLAQKEESVVDKTQDDMKGTGSNSCIETAIIDIHYTSNILLTA